MTNAPNYFFAFPSSPLNFASAKRWHGACYFFGTVATKSLLVQHSKLWLRHYGHKAL